MPTTAATADREARRQARHRGNPERARFHRQPDADEFVIRVREVEEAGDDVPDLVGPGLGSALDPDPDPEPESAVEPEPDAELERGLRRISLGRDAAADAAGHCAGRPAHDDNDQASAAPGTEAPDSGDAEAAAAAAPSGGKGEAKQKGARRRQQQQQQQQQQRRRRAGISTDEIEQVVRDMPPRMTRSMARKVGVQKPRRHFGEGVTTTQILWPVKSDAEAP
ncbi:hypothetical protein H4R18_002747 [Coemansia javaensis]|uniref:Uncharacterized protein n=1 Tax=Coemansia javaensis TaxID=2761396 RepID=A0A9W8HDU7_9FUNG|nr:hypothetical protein H4R18_002747 [Coemansia javaensis]